MSRTSILLTMVVVDQSATKVEESIDSKGETLGTLDRR